MKLRIGFACSLFAFSLLASVASAQLDGLNLGSGQTLKFVQDTQTGFGNATGGGQDSAGGSEINAVWGDIVGNNLRFSISGNLEGNFNKFFLFFDGIAGGENVLDGTNTDGGFNEIQNLAGTTFDNGFTADRGLRIEVGGGFLGINAFNVIDNSNVNIFNSNSGFGALPLSNAGSNGVTFGWDNSNTQGVDGSSAANALSATTGWEFEIDITQFFGGLTQDIGLAGFITSGDAQFVSNQVIGGLAGAGNLGAVDPNFSAISGNQFVVFAIPEPSSALLGLIGVCVLGLRRRK